MIRYTTSALRRFFLRATDFFVSSALKLPSLPAPVLARLVAIVLPTVMFLAAPAGAATWPLKYLVITQAPPTGTPGLTDICPMTTSNPLNVCTLPGYGRVLVTLTPGTVNSVSSPDIYTIDIPAAVGPSIPATSGGDVYSWTGVPRYIGIAKNNAGETSHLTFTFLDGPPDLDRLLLVTLGLGRQPNKATVYTTMTLSEKGTLVGSFPAPTSDPEAFQTGNKVLINSTSSFNSQWTLSRIDLATATTQMQTSATPTLDFEIARIAGDGLGITLGYIQTGTLKVCKVAAASDVLGMQFSFHDSLGLNTFTVPAGPSPDGYCTVGATSYPAGTALTLTEAGLSGYKVTDIKLAPGTLTSHNYDLGTAAFTIGAGVNEITYTNAAVPLGYLEICKAGVANKSFTFVVNNKSYTIPSGACSPAIQVPSGSVVIEEQASTSGHMTQCSTKPAFPVVCDTVNRKATVVVAPGDVSKQTIVTITNAP